MKAAPAGRVVLLEPMAPEASAYALARYSRSPDSVADSLQWVRDRGSSRFLNTYYFQYGHASIADLGHLACCFEGISELAAMEIEDEQLWDGQAKSTRYQDFSKREVIAPEELREPPEREVFERAAADLVDRYLKLRVDFERFLSESNPMPDGMKPAAYQRTIRARALDSARYLLPAGIPTNVGQVTSIRTLEKQMQRLGVSRYREVRSIAREMHAALARPPQCGLGGARSAEPVAPTLAKYAEPDLSRRAAFGRVRAWAEANFAPGAYDLPRAVDLVPTPDPLDEIVATWLYAVTTHPFRVVVDAVSAWSPALRREVLDLALADRRKGAELLRPFNSGYGFLFDIVCDLGAYRDLHRHRRCQQIAQRLSGDLGCEEPPHLDDAGARRHYQDALHEAAAARDEISTVSERAGHYLLPFAARRRALFKMDFAEVEYISRVRSGVKGHLSYRRVAWEMRQRVMEVDRALGGLIEATHPDEQDPLRR